MIFRNIVLAGLLVFLGPETTQPAALAWQVPVPKKYTNEPFAFSAAFKGEPVIESKEISLEPNQKFVLTTFHHRFDRNLVGVLHIAPIPLEKDLLEFSADEQQRLATDFFDGIAKTFLTKFESQPGKLTVKESSFQKNGYPGREYQLGFPNKAKGTFRFYTAMVSCIGNLGFLYIFFE